MNVAGIVAMRPRFASMARAFMRARGERPNIIDLDDMVQIATVQALEYLPRFVEDPRAKFASAIEKRIQGAWSNACAASHIGPPTGTRSRMRKRGQAVNYGEVSYHGFSDWQDWLHGVAGYEDDDEEPGFILTFEQAKSAISDIDAQLEAGDDYGVWHDTKRGQFAVYVRVQGHRQYVRTTQTIEAARAAKLAFLRDFRAHLVANVEDMQ